MKYRGACHCGAIRFEAEAPQDLTVEDCNCSICKKSGYLHLLLPADKFTLIQGRGQLQTYTFNTGTAKHTFCKVCGIKAFYTPRSHPEGVSVNARCLETRPKSVSIEKFDGEHWEDNAHTLAYKSEVE